MIDVVELDTRKGRTCREILRSLPEWFGVPEAIEDYAAAVETMPMFGAMAAATTVGFVALKFHTAAAVEAYVLSVRRERHRQGIGSAPFRAAERWAVDRGAAARLLRPHPGDDRHPSAEAAGAMLTAPGEAATIDADRRAASDMPFDLTRDEAGRARARLPRTAVDRLAGAPEGDGICRRAAAAHRRSLPAPGDGAA